MEDVGCIAVTIPSSPYIRIRMIAATPDTNALAYKNTQKYREF